MARDDCGGVAATNAKQHFTFIRSVDGGNPLPAAGGGSTVCIDPGTMTTTEVKKQYSDVLANSKNIFDLIGNTIDYVLHPTTTITEYRGGYNYQWDLYPFSINVEGDLEMFYRKGSDGKNHLIVKATNILSSLIGKGQVYGSCGNFIPCYADGNFSYGLAATLVPVPPAVNDPQWRYCLGGWWSAGQGQCSADCGGKNPPGGTLYDWGCTTLGQKFEHHGRTPGRMDGPLEWDMGAITPAAASQLGIYIFGRVMRNPLNNPCSSNTPYNGSSMTSGLAFTIPPINVCPPEFVSLTQTADICEECVNGTWHFEPNDLLGINQGQLHLEYVADATSTATTDWSQAEARYFTIYKDQPIDVTVGCQNPDNCDNTQCLAPNTNYCWRAKIVLNDGYEAESDWTYGCMKTLFIPPANMSVPDITVEECTEIDRGNELEQFNQIVCYGGCD